MYEIRNVLAKEVKEGLLWKPIKLSEIKRLNGKSEDVGKLTSHLVSQGIIRKVNHVKVAVDFLKDYENMVGIKREPTFCCSTRKIIGGESIEYETTIRFKINKK
jgi:hypothetical protein